MFSMQNTVFVLSQKVLEKLKTELVKKFLYIESRILRFA